MIPDVLTELDRLLAATPDSHHVCAPLKRSTVVAIAAEIRRLRSQVAELVASSDAPKTKPQRPSSAHNAREW